MFMPPMPLYDSLSAAQRIHVAFLELVFGIFILAVPIVLGYYAFCALVLFPLRIIVIPIASFAFDHTFISFILCMSLHPERARTVPIIVDLFVFCIFIVFPLRTVVIPIAHWFCDHAVISYIFFSIWRNYLASMDARDIRRFSSLRPPPSPSAPTFRVGPWTGHDHYRDYADAFTPVVSPSMRTSTYHVPSNKIYVSAYLFAADEDAPRIVQVACAIEPPTDTPYCCHQPDFAPYAEYQGSMARLEISKVRPMGAALGRTLSLFYDSGAYFEQPNRCVTRVLQRKGWWTHQKWRGNVLLFREQLPGRYMEVQREDLAPAIAYLKDYGRP